MRSPSVFEHRREERAARTFGTNHVDHPYIRNFIVEPELRRRKNKMVQEHLERREKNGSAEPDLTEQNAEMESKIWDNLWLQDAKEDNLCGGKLEIRSEKRKLGDGLDSYRKTPLEVRQRFRELGADSVFVFQLRNPIHNGHALLMRSTYEKMLEQG